MKYAFFLVLISVGNCFGQAYTFIPMNLDTSCLWVHEYYNYHSNGFNECSGEKITYIEKDTVIGSYKYFKLFTYTSEIALSQPQAFCENALFKNDQITFVREDTSLQQIIDLNNNVLLDFSKIIGETQDIGLNGNNPKVDSITIDTFNLIARKVCWGTFGLVNDYKTIEGIGATYNFPIREYGEWFTPAFRLKCHSRNGQILYPNNFPDPCIKKPKTPVGISEYTLNPIDYILTGKNISILGSPQFPLDLIIYDLTGRTLFKYKIIDNKQIDLSPVLNTGLYVFSVTNFKSGLKRIELIR